MFIFGLCHVMLCLLPKSSSSTIHSTFLQGPFVHIASICAAVLSKFMSIFCGVYEVSVLHAPSDLEKKSLGGNVPWRSKTVVFNTRPENHGIQLREQHGKMGH